jgi:ribonuclease VapC
LIAVDSSALIAILRLESEAETFLRIIVEKAPCVMSALNLLETSMVLAGREGGASLWQPLDDFVAEAQIEVTPFDHGQVQQARAAFLRFGKGRHPAALNFGDCAAYALAKSRNLALLFKGEDFVRTDLLPAC